MLVDLRREVALQSRAVDRRTTVGAVLLAWLRSRQGVVSPTSWLRYESLVRLQLAGLARIQASALSAEHVRAHLRTLTPAAGCSALRILRAALALAEHDGIVTRNVAALVSPPKRDTREGIALTSGQLKHFLEVTSEDELYPLWAVMFGTGLRMGEAMALRWTDIDSHSVTVTASLRHQDRRYRGSGPRLALQPPKTAAGRRTAPLAGFAARALATMPRDAVYVFHRHNGKPLNPSTVQRAFAAAVERAGLPPMHLHDARHTAATLALASGATLDDVKRMLGHSSIAITSDVYGHLVTGRQRAIADALDEAVS